MRNQNKARAVMARCINGVEEAGGHRSASAWCERAWMVARWATMFFSESDFAAEMTVAAGDLSVMAADIWESSHGGWSDSEDWPESDDDWHEED